jgi:hypothetical protein
MLRTQPKPHQKKYLNSLEKLQKKVILDHTTTFMGMEFWHPGLYAPDIWTAIYCMGISNSVREMQHVDFGKSEKQSLARDVVQSYAWPTAGTLEIGGVNCGAEMLVRDPHLDSPYKCMAAAWTVVHVFEFGAIQI